MTHLFLPFFIYYLFKPFFINQFRLENLKLIEIWPRQYLNSRDRFWSYWFCWCCWYLVASWAFRVRVQTGGCYIWPNIFRWIWLVSEDPILGQECLTDENAKMNRLVFCFVPTQGRVCSGRSCGNKFVTNFSPGGGFIGAERSRKNLTVRESKSRMLKERVPVC